MDSSISVQSVHSVSPSIRHRQQNRCSVVPFIDMNSGTSVQSVHSVSPFIRHGQWYKCQICPFSLLPLGIDSRTGVVSFLSSDMDSGASFQSVRSVSPSIKHGQQHRCSFCLSPCQAWTAVQVFKDKYAYTSTFQLPLFVGSPSQQMLKQLAREPCKEWLERNIRSGTVSVSGSPSVELHFKI